MDLHTLATGPLQHVLTLRKANGSAAGRVSFEVYFEHVASLQLTVKDVKCENMALLKRNGAVPEAVALSQELAKLRSELLEESDRSKRKTLVTEISLLQTKLDLARKS